MNFDWFISVAQAAEPAVAEAQDAGLVSLFGINLKLFVAQLVNFALVMFILWRWVVRPFSKTLAERQEKIESGIRYAQEMEAERQRLEEQKAAEMRRAREEAEKVIRSATVTAENVKSQTIQEAHRQAEKLIEQTKSSLAAEKQKMIQEIKAEAAELVVLAAEHVIAEKIDPARDKNLISQGLERAAKENSNLGN